MEKNKSIKEYPSSFCPNFLPQISEMCRSLLSYIQKKKKRRGRKQESKTAIVPTPFV
jgi:hypothetical protein